MFKRELQKLESDVSVTKNLKNVGKTPTTLEVNVLRWWGYLRQSKNFSIYITREKVEVCHRLNKQSDRTITKFFRRKDFEHVMRKKSELRKLKPSELNQLNQTKLYINESLCLYYMDLGNQCEKLWN